MKARYAGTCAATGKHYPAGAEIEKGTYGWQIAGSKPADRTVGPNEIRLAGGEGYGFAAYTEGQVVAHKGQWWTVRAAWSEYIREDGLSFGVGDDSGHIYYAICRLATEEEWLPVEARTQAEYEYRCRKVELETARQRLFDPKDGEYVAGDHQLKGEWIKIGAGFNIYGGGEEICITSRHVWYCRNNGADGDNWSANNVRTGGAGAIGYRFAATPERRVWIASYQAWRAKGETK